MTDSVNNDINREPKKPEIINKVFEIEDPLLNGVIRSTYCAQNMTEEEVKNKIRELFSNPEFRKSMDDFGQNMKEKHGEGRCDRLQ